MFWSKSAYTPGRQRSDLKLRPNEGLSCRLSSLFGEGSNLFAPIQGSRQIFTTPSKASELYFSNDTIKAQKSEYFSSQLLSRPCERGSGAHFVSIKCPQSDLCWALPAPIHSYRQRITGGRTLAKNWIMLQRLVQGGGSGEPRWGGGQISPGIIHLCPTNRIRWPVLLLQHV